MKIVINRCYGGFGLSAKAEQVYLQRANVTDPDFYSGDIKRDDPVLVALVEEWGEAANGNYSKLSVVEIPDGVEWGIEEYDGIEWISEKHRTWS